MEIEKIFPWPLCYGPMLYGMRRGFVRILSNPPALFNFMLNALDNIFVSDRPFSSPVFLDFEPSGICPCHCAHCFKYQIASGVAPVFMEYGLYEKAMAHNARKAVIVCFDLMGEPTLNTHLPKMIKRARKDGAFVFVTTSLQSKAKNIRALARAKPDYISLSCDSAQPWAYEKVKAGASFKLFEDNLKVLVREIRKLPKYHRPFVHFKPVINKYTEKPEQRNKIRAFGHKFGIQYVTFKKMCILKNGKPIKTRAKEDRYTISEKSAEHIRRTGKRCGRLRFASCISATGQVFPCEMDVTRKYSLGNIKNHSIKEIWGGKRAVAFRKKSDEAKEEGFICTSICPFRF